MKKLLLTLFVALSIVGIYYYKTSKKVETSSEPDIHYHAGFIVFNDGKNVDFSDTKYMQIKPCLIDGQEEKATPEDEQIEKAHLHDNVGDVVHVEAKEAKWGDLFTNIKYDLDYSKITAYINGQKVDDLKSISIKEDDSLVIFIGKVDQKLLSQALTKEYIEEKGKSSSSCSD